MTDETIEPSLAEGGRNYSDATAKVLNEACGSPDQWSRWDRAVYDLAEQADAELSRLRSVQPTGGVTSPDYVPTGEGKPVAWRWRWNYSTDWHQSESRPDDHHDRVVEPLYAAPPSPSPQSIEVGEMVERLNHVGGYALVDNIAGAYSTIVDAASLLIALDAERGRLREALKPFADAAKRWDDPPGIVTSDNVQLWQNGKRIDYITVGDLRRARSALPASDEK